jgi:hypothetical protein
MSTPQTEEYLQARIESCRLLGLNADDLSPHEAIRADLLTVLRLWLDNSQTTLLGGGTADAGKLLSVAEALAKFIPEPEHKNHRVDPRETMWQTYKAMRERGELFERAQEPTLRRRIAELEAEVEQLRAGTTAANAAVEPPAPPDPDVLRLSRPTNERTSLRNDVSPSPTNERACERSHASPSPPAASAAPSPSTPQPPQACSAEESRRRMDIVNQPVSQHVRDTRPANEPWRDHVAGGAFHDRWRNNNW